MTLKSCGSACDDNRCFRGVQIRSVESESPAERIGIRTGGRLVAIDGSPVRDELDLIFLSSERFLKIEWIDTSSAVRRKTVRKRYDESLGITLEPLKPRRCRNRCIFCFVDQNPPSARSALRFKDEDFRLSFTHGHYITARNLAPDDLERIASQRLSPLYVSVHATRHDLRCRMLGVSPRRTADLMDTLRLLVRGGIEFHTQIVLCPGWNDGAELDRTLDDLETLGEAVQSIAVVPVGLTVHRKGLTPLDPLTPSLARDLIRQVAPRQKRLARQYGHRTVLLADEIFLVAGEELPRYKQDEIESQIENGVGMIARFREGWERAVKRLPARVLPKRRVTLLTGLLGARVLEPLIERLGEIDGLRVDVLALENTFFGRSVTVSGLLSGADFDRGVAQAKRPDKVLLPANALRPDDLRFIDDLTLDELRAKHPTSHIEPIEGGAREVLRAILNEPSKTA